MIYLDSSMTSLEVHDLLEKVTDPEVRRLVDTVMHEPKVYTRGGRINKSALCRLLELKPAEVDELFAKLRNQFLATEDVPLFRFQVKEELTYESHVYLPGEVIKVFAVTKKLKKLCQHKKIVQLGKSA
jgi:alpha-ketoglutarate-dependent taurine dioxygenase